ncbi:hypothetical protein ACFU76_16865 [Streptomyces sp. NPDC057539]|uniref:hypothetical protein n=1 Tax=Streptomyces sp. NPDC057539 TaxID=3346159 RepID=UPI00368A0938
MAVMSKKFLIPIAALAVVGLTAASLYVLGLPPFEKRGEIKASSVCEALGNSEKASVALEVTLPSEPEYSFRGRVDSYYVTQGSSQFKANCSVYGEDKILLSAGTEIVPTQPADSWADYALGDDTGDHESFTAGSAALITTNNKVAIQVPCAKPGSIPGGEYSVKVRVDLETDAASDDAKVRQGLKDLAVEAARFAHDKTQCNLPSKLPE